MKDRKVEILSKTLVFSKAIFRIVEVRLRHRRFDGRMGNAIVRLSLERGDSVAALVHDIGNACFILTEQFRYPTLDKGPGWIHELPAGMVGEDEDATRALVRELAEETGYAARDPRPIGTFYLSPGGSSERIHLYYIRVDGGDRAAAGGGLRAEGEDIRVVQVAVEDALAGLANGTCADAKTALALQWFALHRDEL